MTEQFQFDTSSVVYGVPVPGHVGEQAYTWDRLSPGVQGCIAAMLEGLVRDLHNGGCKFGVRAFPDGKLRAPGFSDLHPDTLARIIADWEGFEKTGAWQAFNEALQGNLNEEGAEFAAGQALWLTRNRYDWAIAAGFWADSWGVFSDALALAACELSEITPYLGDDGKVFLRESV